MDFAYRQHLIQNQELQYLQAATMMAIQQKLKATMQPIQMQQNLVMASLMRHREAMEIKRAQQSLNQMLAFGHTIQNQRINFPTGIKVEETTMKSLIPVTEHKAVQPHQSLSKSDVRPMVQYLLNNLGTAEEKSIAEVRSRYSSNELLCSLFDSLVNRYNSTLKTKEEMIKYTLRKALRWMRLKVSQGNLSDPKEQMKLLIQRYFGSILKNKQGINNLNDDQIIEKFLPFKKESRIKTMNTSFVFELFESDEFAKDYQEFLKTFNGIIVSDNNRKVEKFIKFLEECYSNQSFEKLKNFKRIPWLNFWINNTMNQARDLPNLAGRNRDHCKPKTEALVSCEYEPQLEKKVKIEFVDNETESNSTLSSSVRKSPEASN